MNEPDNAYWGADSAQDGWNQSPAPAPWQGTTEWGTAGGVYPEQGSPWWSTANTEAYPTTAAREVDVGAGTLQEFEADEEDDSSATSSDSGQEKFDDIYIGEQWVGDVPEDVAAEHVYQKYRKARRTWRRFTGRPVRKFRRFVKFQRRRKGKGKGKGNLKGTIGKSTPGFMWTHEDSLTYLKGKGRGLNSSGKGFGRKKNPRDKSGAIMKCHNCGSEEHLAARCRAPRRPKAPGKGKIDFSAFA